MDHERERDDRAEQHPELEGYVPGEVGAVRRLRMQRVMRVVVVLAIVGLVLPGILIGISTASRTAELACRIVASNVGATTSATEARFDLTGAEGPGWYCYATAFNGVETQLQFLGFIPEIKVLPGTPGVDV